MINGSTAFNNAVNEGGHPYIIRISENGSIIDCTVSACTFVKGSTGAESFGVGTVFVPYAELEITGLNRTLENADILIELGVQIDSTTTEWINIGYFKVSKVQSSAIKTNITAIGRITALFNAVPTLPSVITLPSLIASIQSTIRNMGFPTFTIKTDGLIISTETITSDLSGKTCRQLLEIITSLIGCYATEDNNGNVVLFTYNNTTTISYDGSRMITHPIVNDFDFSLTNIKVIKSEEQTLDDGTVIPEVSYQYDTSTQPNLVINNEYMENQSMFNAFCTNCIGLVYRPSTIVLANGDPRLEAIDVLTITDTNGAIYTVPVFSVTDVLTGGITTTMIAPGETETEADTSAKGPISQQVDVLSSSVVNAQISANLAKVAADAASQAADLAEADADAAQQSADNAQQSANSAQNSADIAFTQLSIVQNIVGVLDLIAQHGEYAPTGDEEVQPSKWYFNRSGTSPDYEYSVVNNPTSVYHLTGDTAIASDKTYYTLSGTGTEEDPYVYTEVENPVVENIGSYYEKYYELSDISESIQNYVSSHLVLLNDGLWLQADNNAAKIHLRTTAGEEGVVIYGSDNTQLAQYGANTVIGDPEDFHIVIDGQEIGFYKNDVRVAYMRGDELYVENNLSFGHFIFMERANGHFTLKLID